MCYKPDMRNWMRERFKRRKAKESGPKQDTPSPLQPKYFEEEVAPSAEHSQPESAESAAGLAASESAARSTAGPVKERPSGHENAQRRPRRRRRGRGGRERSSPRQPEAPAPNEAVAPASVQPPATAAEAVRTPRGVVVLAIGLPGSGKSSWFKRHDITPLSSDLLRALLFDDPTEQRFQDLIFSNLRSMLKARLIARRPTNYVDATNLTPHERQSWIKLARDYHYEPQAVFFDVPVEVCLERNQRRERVVPEDVMRRMAAKLRSPTFEEGFTKITVVKVKKKENEAVLE